MSPLQLPLVLACGKGASRALCKRHLSVKGRDRSDSARTETALVEFSNLTFGQELRAEWIPNVKFIPLGLVPGQPLQPVQQVQRFPWGESVGIGSIQHAQQLALRG